jgi:uncharacterized protein YecE (DUF72 family)
MGKVYSGTSGWAYASWKPGFYPAKLPSRDFLKYYATRLNSIEVNYTFRGTLTKPLANAWIAATPAHFRFAVKAPQLITHIKRLRAVKQPLKDFLSSLSPIADTGKLGPVLYQLPPNF